MNSDDLTVHPVRRAALATPARLAIQDASGDQYTFGEPHAAALRWAHALEQSGAAKHDRVAVMLPTTAEACIVQLAVGWLGGTVVALNTMLRGQLLTRALAVTDSTVMVTDREHYAEIGASDQGLAGLRSIIVTGLESGSLNADDSHSDPVQILRSSDLLDGSQAKPRPGPELAGIQGIIFTSGTTGPSKAVMLSHEFVLNCARRLVPGGADAVGGGYYSPWPVAHSLGSLALAAAVDRGVTLVLRDKFIAESFWRDVREFQCRTAVLVTVAGELWGAPQQPDDASNPLAYVAMTPLIQDYRGFARRFAVDVSGIYGSTEIGPLLTAVAPAHYRVSAGPLPATNAG